MTRLAFERVTVQYPVYDARASSLRQHLVRLSTGGRLERSAGVQLVTALRDASFVLEHGDTVGLVGHNGAGKSTLLRTMAGVYRPVAGRIEREGRVSTVFELGAGMDRELSGRENIVRMALLLGLSRAEVRAGLPGIEEFTQLGAFLDLPVRIYSAGMMTRLMFAVATATRPDILLLDEVLGAGDAAFQVQAARRLEALIASVGILVLASHDRATLKKYCRRFFLLEHGWLREVAADEI